MNTKKYALTINFMSTLTNHAGCVFFQVNKYDVMKYTDKGVPPFCMITIKPISDETTPSDLKFTVSLAGVNTPNILQLTRETDYSGSQLVS